MKYWCSRLLLHSDLQSWLQCTRLSLLLLLLLLFLMKMLL